MHCRKQHHTLKTPEHCTAVSFIQVWSSHTSCNKASCPHQAYCSLRQTTQFLKKATNSREGKWLPLEMAGLGVKNTPAFYIVPLEFFFICSTCHQQNSCWQNNNDTTTCAPVIRTITTNSWHVPWCLFPPTSAMPASLLHLNWVYPREKRAPHQGLVHTISPTHTLQSSALLLPRPERSVVTCTHPLGGAAGAEAVVPAGTVHHAGDKPAPDP